MISRLCARAEFRSVVRDTVLSRISRLPARTPATVLLLLSWLLTLGVVGCANALAGGSEVVRVLIYDASEALDIGRTHDASRVELIDGRLISGERNLGSVWLPQGSGPWKVGSRTVRGRIAVRVESGRIQVLNRVDLESYVASIVGGEMSASWPKEALRAQAVAARTYVLHEALKRRSRDWDVRATAASQVYRGISAESGETLAAAKATRSEVLTYRGEPILAVFHSTAGGRTATAGEVWGEDLPYLRVVEVEEEDGAPHAYWRTQFSRSDLERVFSAQAIEVDSLRGLLVTQRTGSGRVERLELHGEGSSEQIGGTRLRRLVSSLGLRSTLFDVKRTADGFAFVGSGYGHGVGMSQWGARSLAERGESYQRILARFYPGTRLERWSSHRVAGLVPSQHVTASEENSRQAGQGEVR